MKQLFLFFALLCPFVALAQDLPIDSATKKITYTAVVPIEGVSFKQLDQNARDWFQKNKISNINVQQENDVTKVTGNGWERLEGSLLNYTITLMLKEGRYKYVITDIGVEEASRKVTPLETPYAIPNIKNKEGKFKMGYRSFFNPIIEKLDALQASLKATLATKPASSDF